MNWPSAIRRRIERHLAEALLLPGKTLDTFAFEAVPMIFKAQITAIAAGDAWLEKSANLLLFGSPGGGKSHLASAIGLALVEKGWKVLFTRTTDLVQKLQVARRNSRQNRRLGGHCSIGPSGARAHSALSAPSGLNDLLLRRPPAPQQQPAWSVDRRRQGHPRQSRTDLPNIHS
ncbi:MAG: transposase [Tardiphaga sp.]|nr:transposase [Tardiphaga sp.]